MYLDVKLNSSPEPIQKKTSSFYYSRKNNNTAQQNFQECTDRVTNKKMPKHMSCFYKQPRLACKCAISGRW